MISLRTACVIRFFEFTEFSQCFVRVSVIKLLIEYLLRKLNVKIFDKRFLDPFDSKKNYEYPSYSNVF